MAGASSFRRVKIENVIGRLATRRAVLKNQLKQPEFADTYLYIQGQLSAVDLIIRELAVEFDATDLPCLDGMAKSFNERGE